MMLLSIYYYYHFLLIICLLLIMDCFCLLSLKKSVLIYFQVNVCILSALDPCQQVFVAPVNSEEWEIVVSYSVENDFTTSQTFSCMRSKAQIVFPDQESFRRETLNCTYRLFKTHSLPFSNYYVLPCFLFSSLSFYFHSLYFISYSCIFEFCFFIFWLKTTLRHAMCLSCDDFIYEFC